MIVELTTGALISAVAMVATKKVDIGKSVRDWILSLSRFVYHSGHPVWDDDQRFKRVSKEYRSVALAFLSLTLKLLLIVAIIFIAVGVTTAILEVGRGDADSYFTTANWTRLLFPPYLLHWPFLVGTLAPLILAPLISGPLLTGKTSQDPAAVSTPYSVMDKFLHYVFLGNQPIARGLFGLECLIKRRRLKQPRAHVYVSGLARSGSTSLMQYLAQLPGYRSLSYRNMPLIFMPQTGLKLVSKEKGSEQERSHQDGMTHSLDTHEALEEPFWLHFCGGDYVKDDQLVRHEIPPKVHDKYKKFRALTAHGQVYLAKNNNHLLRASSLHDLDTRQGLVTRTIIPFRAPLAQAKSLLRQHQSLSNMQQSDNFFLDYMDFLGHYEFGIHIKTSTLETDSSLKPPQQSPTTVEYWLDVWNQFYEKAYDLYQGQPEFCFFCYESYLQNPKASLEKLLAFLDVSDDAVDALDVQEWTGQSLTMPNENEVDEKYRITYSKMAKAALNA